MARLIAALLCCMQIVCIVLANSAMFQAGLPAAYSKELMQQQQQQQQELHQSPPDLAAFSLSARSAASIEELMQQIPLQFEEEKRLLERNPSAPAAITIGDSITAFGYKEDGWVTQLKQDFPSTVFVNKGVPMGSSRSGVLISNWTLGNSRSPLFQKSERLKLVTLCFGANDASINRRDASWRMVPEAEYRTNLLASISTFLAQGVSNILLITPPPAGSPPRIDRSLAATQAYADIVKDIGRELQLPVVDIFAALQQVPDWTTAALLPDGLHLNPVGNRVVHDLVLAAIQTHYRAL